MIKICLVSANRAEYGILKNLIKSLNQEKNIKLSLIITGAHLDKKFGLTKNEIYKDNIKIQKIINIFPKNDTNNEVLKSISKSLNKFVLYFNQVKFDFLIVLGDRFDIIAPSITAFFKRIRIIHINGGDITQGSLDNNIRDLITSISSIHFVTNKYSLERVKKITGSNKNIYNVGSLSADRIINLEKLSKFQIFKRLNIKLNKHNYLVTFHPITNNIIQTKIAIKEILDSLINLRDTTIIFTYPNNDEGSDIIIKSIKKFNKAYKNSYIFKSLGFENYISLCHHMECVIGNSSSFVIEIPFLNIPSINIGNRQKGRFMSNSVITIDANRKKILKTLNKIRNKKFKFDKKKNIYRKPNTIKNIVKFINKHY